ncbi:MAG: HEAT repeat domain-containing protein [Thermoguttaceae bacterium]
MKRPFVLLWGMFSMAVVLGLGGRLRAAEEPSDELVQMIVGLVMDKDRDMRSMGLQQIREEAKGPAATQRFVNLLPKLPAESQAGLLDALGDRGDKTARPAVLAMLKSPDEQVRAAAARGLGSLGEAADVPLLAQSLAASGPEKTAARSSLARLRGQEIDTAIAGELKRAKPDVRAGLLAVLAVRGTRQSLPVVLHAAEDADARVRAAALAALRALAGPDQAAAIVNLLKAAKEDSEQWKVEQALLAVCARGREACTEAILAGMADAQPSSAAALLRALARCGGDKALAAIVSATKDRQPAVSGEAVRLLANWPEPSAVAPLLAIARQTGPVGRNAVAVQGLIRLASPLKDRPADLPLLAKAMELAKRPEEKRLVLGVLRDVATPESFALVAPGMDDPVLADDACLAAVAIAEKLAGPAQARRVILEKARTKAKDPQVRERAEKALESLGSS